MKGNDLIEILTALEVEFNRNYSDPTNENLFDFKVRQKIIGVMGDIGVELSMLNEMLLQYTNTNLRLLREILIMKGGEEIDRRKENKKEESEKS